MCHPSIGNTQYMWTRLWDIYRPIVCVDPSIGYTVLYGYIFRVDPSTGHTVCVDLSMGCRLQLNCTSMCGLIYCVYRMCEFIYNVYKIYVDENNNSFAFIISLLYV